MQYCLILTLLSALHWSSTWNQTSHPSIPCLLQTHSKVISKGYGCVRQWGIPSKYFQMVFFFVIHQVNCCSTIKFGGIPIFRLYRIELELTSLQLRYQIMQWFMPQVTVYIHNIMITQLHSFSMSYLLTYYQQFSCSPGEHIKRSNTLQVPTILLGMTH